VVVDKTTFDKYRQCSDPVFQPLFQELITINSFPTPANYARIKLNGDRCPFLSEKLCSIQKHLGEDHLSHTCATFPRNIHDFLGTIERSLDLSCPEAARLALTDPRPIRFQLSETDMAPASRDGVSAINAKTPGAASDSWETRDLVISILQNRRYPLSKRLIFVAQLCDLLTGISKAGEQEQTFGVLHEFRDRIESGRVEEALDAQATDQPLQLGLFLELINARIRIDFVPQRYLDLFQEFASGIQLQGGCDWNQLIFRYAQACRQYYMPFMDQHEYLLENYLVSYAFRTVFPFAWPSGSLAAECNPDPAERYMVMASYYSITKTVMIGVSGKYKSDFGIDHVVRCIQSSSRLLEHCISYPAKILEVLASKGITTARQMAIVTGS